MSEINSDVRDQKIEGEGDGKKESRKLMGATPRKKACRFCTDSEFTVDYKNLRILSLFMSEHGKLVPRRISGNCADHQRKLTTAAKRARNLALVGFTTLGF
jgi:small subunit ribosomal protein S18